MSPLAWSVNEELETGVVIGVKKVTRINVNANTFRAMISYESYVDEERMNAGKKIEELSVEVDLAGLDPQGALASAVVQAVQVAEAAAKAKADAEEQAREEAGA